jgi:hypothetical protein
LRVSRENEENVTDKKKKAKKKNSEQKLLALQLSALYMERLS